MYILYVQSIRMSSAITFCKTKTLSASPPNKKVFFFLDYGTAEDDCPAVEFRRTARMVPGQSLHQNRLSAGPLHRAAMSTLSDIPPQRDNEHLLLRDSSQLLARACSIPESSVDHQI